MADDDKLDAPNEIKKAEETITEPKKAAATKGGSRKKAAKKKTAKKKSTKKRAAAKKKSTPKTQLKEAAVVKAASTDDSVQHSTEKTVASQNIQENTDEPVPEAAMAAASNTSKGMSFWPKTLVWVVLVIAGFLFLRYLAHDPSNRIGLTKGQAKRAPVASLQKEESRDREGSDPDTHKITTDAGETKTLSPELPIKPDDVTVAPQIIDSARDSSAPTGLVGGSAIKESTAAAGSSVDQGSNMESNLEETMRDVDSASQDQSGSAMRETMRPIEAGSIPIHPVQPARKSADDAMIQSGRSSIAAPQTEATLPEASVSTPQAGVTTSNASVFAPIIGRSPDPATKPAYTKKSPTAGQKREPSRVTGTRAARERYYGYRQRPGFQRQPMLHQEQVDKSRAVESRRQTRAQRGAQPYYYPPAHRRYRYSPMPYRGYGGYRPYPFNRTVPAPSAPMTNSTNQ